MYCLYNMGQFNKNQLALFFYNNSNNVAILLPQRAFKRRKAFIYGLFHGYEITPTPQIALQTKQFCLGDLSCGISIIYFVLYCTWLLMLRYHFVIALITHRATYGNDACLVACSLFGIIAQNETVVKRLNDYYWYIYYVLIQVRVFHLQEYHIFEFEFLYD